MKPALTAEEWDFVKEAHVGDGLSDHIDTLVGKRDIDEGLHAAAAIALYECRLPFGFTRKDIKVLLAFGGDDEPEIVEITERIEALLPPESE